MSTRSCIARVTSKEGAKKFKWQGVYHHWDGHPQSIGSTLFQARNDHFEGDTKAMLKYLIDDHPAGFSTINNCDFNLPSAPRINGKLEICKHCGIPNWRHYAQYYTENNEEWVKAGKPECPPHGENQFLVSTHNPEAIEIPHGPECFPASEENDPITEKNASKVGCEYVYAFTKDGNTMYVLSSHWSEDESKKMIGMFGMGDPKAKWKIIGKIDLDGDEPTEEQWQEIPIKQTERRGTSKEEFIAAINK